ncbi:hypothetical protein PAXRUDRAFT_154518, partial [Paxillus rubicundulus Ve08.2h10]
EESVFQLLTGLPQSLEWRMFKSQLEQWLHDAYSGTVITSALNSSGSISVTFQHNPMTFESCSTCICSEASHQLNEKNLIGPRSEYVHMATTSTSADRNSIIWLQKHPKNPQGIFCTMPVCSASHRGDHNHMHCFSPGRGMEGQTPWQQKKNKKKDRTPHHQGHPFPLHPQWYPPCLFLLSLQLLLPLHSHHMGMPSLGIFHVHPLSLWTL